MCIQTFRLRAHFIHLAFLALHSHFHLAASNSENLAPCFTTTSYPSRYFNLVAEPVAIRLQASTAFAVQRYTVLWLKHDSWRSIVWKRPSASASQHFESFRIQFVIKCESFARTLRHVVQDSTSMGTAQGAFISISRIRQGSHLLDHWNRGWTS